MRFRSLPDHLKLLLEVLVRNFLEVKFTFVFQMSKDELVIELFRRNLAMRLANQLENSFAFLQVPSDLLS